MGIIGENIILKRVETSAEKIVARTLIEKYHSYVPTYCSVGRRIDYLICVNNSPVGVIGIGSGTYPPCKDVLKYLNVTKQQYREIFNTIGNNWRFCLSVHIKNLGTKVLKMFREQVYQDWYFKYGDKLKYIITFVGGGHDGAVYKADNWILIGTTSGLPNHKSVSMKWDAKDDIKNKFVKPTGENKKFIYIYKLKNKLYKQNCFKQLSLFDMNK